MRLNIWAAAGAGKSATAAAIFHKLKCKNYNIELAKEVIKSWAYEGKVPKSFDQVFLFGSQVNAEDMLLQAGVEHVVTDSPVPMQVFYARKYGFPCWQSLLEISNAFEVKHPSINIFLDRSGLAYKEEGRYENEVQAKANDAEMRAFMQAYVAEYKVLKTIDLDQIVEYIEKSIGGNEQSEPRKPTMLDRILKKFFT